MSRIIIVLVGLFISFQLFAGNEQYSSRIEGADIYVGSSFDLYDSRYFEMNTNAGWASSFTNYKVRNKVQLGINPEVFQTLSYTAEVEVKVEYDTWNGSGFSTQVENRTLTVYYDAASDYTNIDDISTFVFSGGHRVNVEIMSMTAGIDPNDLFLESSVEVERYYSFDGSAVIGSWYQFVGESSGNDDYIEFNWDVKEGAEYYELEWVHINDYTIDQGVYVNVQDLEYDFYLNSTRISTPNNWYKIPAIFDHGYVIFRVRAIGAQGSDFKNRYDGEWDGLEKGTVGTFPDGNLASFPNARIIVIASEYDSKMNWAHQVGYTEDGKRFEGISFMDGLGRGRQSVSHNTVTEQAVVSNVYYDELGRPAVSDLPTPVEGEQLMHYPNFNLPEVGGTGSIGYSMDHFDDESVTNDPSCAQTSLGFSLTSGSGQYYSSSNPNLDGENAHIPDAENFPFSRVTYLEDFTNRPRRIGAFGDDLKIGSGHETQMIYVSPNQVELNKLFGSEVGYYEHYKKMITIDANGQAYAQYTDMAGRVVASYMIGPAPSNLDALTGNTLSSEKVDLLVDGSSQTVTNTPPSTMLTHYEYFDHDDIYTFNYGFTPSEYEGTCLPQNICLDCVYDLNILIEDECGVEAFTKTIQINGTTFDAICGNEPAPAVEDAMPLDVPVALITGRYAIKKTLSVNQDAINEYWCTYIDNSTCLTPLSDHFNSFYTEEEFANCTEDIFLADLTGCDAHREFMLEDVSPGGQYGLYDESGGVYSISDVASNSVLGAWASGTYTDENGAPYVPQDLNDFIDNFRDEWAEELLSNHPEYCYLQFCELNSASDAYTDAMLATDDYSVALAAGYFKPLSSPTAQNVIPTNVFNGGATNYDPFFETGGQGYAFRTDMGSLMTGIDIPLTGGGTETVDIWEYAILMGMGCGPFADVSEINSCLSAFRDDQCNLDLVWINFRDAYLEFKSSIYFDAQQAYASANNCSNDCIGSSAIGCEDYADKFSRFGNTSAEIGTTGTSIQDLIDGLTDPNTFLTTQSAAACQQYAEQAAADWMLLLSGCDFVNTIGQTATDNLEADMTTLISSGCDQNNPQGASTNPTGIATQNGNTVYSLEELLADYGLTESNLCTDLLVSTPGPYQTAEEALSQLEKPLDDCGCNLMLEANALADQMSITEEEALVQLTGLDMQDIDYLICACEKALGGVSSDWAPGYVWNTTELSALEAIGLTIPAQLSCEECEVNCSMVNTDLASLETRFNMTDFSSQQNYETILTNYLNQQYGYSLSYPDYAAFIGQCGATANDPYCTVNPLLEEWAEMMTLVAFRGQLLNDQASQIDLLTENIVYEHSELNGAFAGNNYWSSQSGNTLTTYLGTTGDNCTIDLTTDIPFEKIVGFGTILPLSNTCTSNNTFQIEVQYIECGEITSKLIDGTSNCFDAVDCICEPSSLVLCNDISPMYTGPCYQPRLDELYQNATEAFLQGVKDEYEVFRTDYNEQCAKAFDTENFNYSGDFRQYQYNLFYYDQAGNLIQTIAPEGVDELSATQNAAINTARDGVLDSQNGTSGTAVVPAHTFKTTYEYNSYNQLTKTTNPDQIGDTKFWYDFYGRIVASQNPVQASENKYSYSLYDAQGRPVEVGQVVKVGTSSAQLDIIVKTDDLGDSFKSWVSSGVLTEVTVTKYDRPLNASVEAMFENGAQDNLRLRVASVLYFNTYSGTLSGYRSATHYSYDIHGNVKEQIQDLPELSFVEQDQKSTLYEYELISGNVEKVVYQKDELDQFTHEYQYDELNRLTEVFTSKDNVHQMREAHYYYYDYGPLARTELGQYKVQGQDFAYTINGWLKAMNASTLDKTRDIGLDGNNGYLLGSPKVHRRMAIDVTAYTIGYFDGDYTAIGTSNMEMTSVSTDAFRMESEDLFNGNIRHLVTSIYDLRTLGTVYSYDQLQRLTEMTAFENTNSNNTWTGIGSTQEYYNAYSYDKNGNITSLQRNGTATTNSLFMDNFAYTYTTQTNQLEYVTDGGLDDGTSLEGDIKSGMPAGNYQYDAIGQLVKDEDEEIAEIVWRSGDKKMASLVRTTGSTLPDLEFHYNPFGLRIVKIEKTKDASGNINSAEDWNFTYYAHDANGQVMAVYDLEVGQTNLQARIAEFHIYGASRVGMLKTEELIYDNGSITPSTSDVYQSILGDHRYELTNHLGNVQAVVTDRTVWNTIDANYEAVVVMTSDYYPFGMQMPERHNQYGPSSDIYRYAYNGMEVDNEVSGNGNSYTTEFRQYDPRLGRWKSLDPLMSMFPWQSPYCAFDNNPIYYVDPYGLSATNGGEGEPEVGSVCYDTDHKEILRYEGDGEWSTADPGDFGGRKANPFINFGLAVPSLAGFQGEYGGVKVVFADERIVDGKYLKKDQSTAWSIAQANEIPLEDLYKWNRGLRKHHGKIGQGQMIIVSDPKDNPVMKTLSEKVEDLEGTRPPNANERSTLDIVSDFLMKWLETWWNREGGGGSGSNGGSTNPYGGGVPDRYMRDTPWGLEDYTPGKDYYPRVEKIQSEDVIILNNERHDSVVTKDYRTGYRSNTEEIETDSVIIKHFWYYYKDGSIVDYDTLINPIY